MIDKPAIDWSALNYSGFARLAADARLSQYEKVGFPDSYREGFEAAIFADIRAKLPRLEERGLTVVDIGPGCSDLPRMLIELCRTQGHRLVLIDSPEMLSLLPDAPFVEKQAGPFPHCSAEVAHLRGKVSVMLSYSVLHYVFADADPAAFLDAALGLLAPGGEFLIGDIPNISKRRRFFASNAGIAFHRAFTGTDTLPPADADSSTPRIDDAAILGLIERAREAGADAYWLPQPPSLPIANRREDVLIRKP